MYGCYGFKLQSDFFFQFLDETSKSVSIQYKKSEIASNTVFYVKFNEIVYFIPSIWGKNVRCVILIAIGHPEF